MTWMSKEQAGARRRRRQERLERPEYGWIWKPLLAALGLYLVVTVALGIWWSRPPPPFEIEQAVMERRGELAAEPARRGAVSVATLGATVATLLDKPGGYLRNDLMPPGLWLDNMPNWELGVLQQARDLAQLLPIMEQGDTERLEEAAQRLLGDSRDWFYPSTEHRLERAVEALDAHLVELAEGGEAGFAPGVGLADWLARVEARLDDLGLRLSASVGSREQLRRLDLDGDALPPRTPWHRIDDIFFEARGAGWGLIQLLEGVQRDQADVLEEAGVTEEWQRLIAELERTQRRLWSPVVLNGSGFGIFANHSLVMAHHVLRARDLASGLAAALEPLPEGLATPEAREEAEPVRPPVEEVRWHEEAAVEPPPEALSAPEGEADNDATEADAERRAQE